MTEIDELNEIYMGGAVNKERAAQWIVDHHATIADVGRAEITLLVHATDASGFCDGVVCYQIWNPDDIEVTTQSGDFLRIWMWWD